MDKIEIAGKKTIKDWKDIVGVENKLKIDCCDNEKWDKVFEFFELRTCTRYLKPIDAILNMKSYKGEGFAIVNLQCSLIEMIESFINGWINEGNKWKKNNIEIKNTDIGLSIKANDTMKNVGVFISFFKYRSVFQEYNIKGEEFFWNVRCALLHETQTKNNWRIKLNTEKTGLSYDEKDGEKIIYRENFQSDLKLLIDRYKDVIINGGKFDGIPACILRKNFIAKFNHICKES